MHESVELSHAPGRLTHELEHYAYRDVSHHLATIDRYTTLAAEQWVAEGRRTTALAAIIHPPLAFLRNYVLRGGFRDGGAGLLVSALNSYYVFLKLAEAVGAATAAARGQASRWSNHPRASAPG